MKKILSVILAVVLTASVIPFAFAAEKETVILYTNDIHCAIDDYPVIAAYRAELIAQGADVITVDAGDAIHGEVIGTLTDGGAIVDIMNAVGYDYAVPGNHEYDYGMDTLLDLAENKAEYEYICSNFYYLPDAQPVFSAYAIKDAGDYQIALVGISTPETVTKANPEYFKDENGDFIYGFPANPDEMTNENLYECIQESVDDAKANGADFVVAVGHTGILGTADGWKSTDIIANTSGIDYYIDAHSHETIESADYTNKDSKKVVLTSTGTKFANFGVLTLSGENADFELVNPDNIDVHSMSDEAKSAYDSLKDKVNGYNEDIAYLFEKIGTSEANLVVSDEVSWLVRRKGTNAGDFVADAYRAVTGADVALCNGGGVRSAIAVGDVSRKMLMDMNPWSNPMCVIEITGQQLVDTLEHGARACPEMVGGFFQVSGVSYEINTWRETPVITDQLGNFVEIDEYMERRVSNVIVNGEPVDPDKKYTVAGSQYVLIQGGDGLTMLDGAKVVAKDELLCDSEMLIKYFTETLGGKITAGQYGNPDGDGRIRVISENPDAPVADYEIKVGETLTVTVPPQNEETPVYVRFIPEADSLYRLRAESEGIDTACELIGPDGEMVLIVADDENGSDFCLEYDLRKGKPYYFKPYTYSEETLEFNVTLECGHSFENGICVVCGEACAHSETGFLGLCGCGKVFLGVDISAGDELECDSSMFVDGKIWLRFIPEESGTFLFESFTKEEIGDPDCSLYDSTGEWIVGDYDSNGFDFELYYTFEAGETYYFEVYNSAEETVCTVKLARVTHTDANGNVHKVEYVEETYSDCVTHGYTEGLYCPECEEYISGHEEKELNWLHPDDDMNEICDLCGSVIDYSDIYPECGHICHSDHRLLSIIWKAANFFFRLLGINQMCECGELHYSPWLIPQFPTLF